MASLASLVTLGSSGASSSSGYHEMVLSLVNKGSVPRGVCCCSFRHLGKGKRWRYVSVCRSSVITDYRSEQGNPGAVGNAYKGTNNGDADFILKPAPKPSLTPPSRPERPSSANSARDLSNSNVNSRVGSSNDMGERKKVIDTLDEVLEKAEKLEISNSQQVNARAENKTAYKPSPVASTTGRGSGNVGNSPDSRKTKAAKSVWRKGNPVSNVPPVNTAPPVVIKGRNPEPMTEPNIGVNGGLQSQAPPPSRPSLPPEKPEYTLQARPSVAPPPPPPPKKSVILKDKGAAQKLPNADGKERKQPILVDKFATKKPAADPQAAQAVIAPAKPSKVVTGKFRDDYRKRGGPAGGARRRIKGDEDLEDASELNVSIPGAASRRKGRKFNRASRKAARLQAARDAAPVRVEILEVGEDGMSTEELAHHLAIGHGQIFGYLYSKGIRPDGVQTLDKSMVKMICNEYGVEVIDKDPFKIEDMAVKKEFLDEEDLDKLVDRPPVITIMGHVDHGKTTLLDHIRKTKVVASEAGGITQGIGAYKVQVPVDGKIRNCVFLDTPGHAAFGAMRARGAKVTDICVIVVAADDGIRPQTNEAIAHARAADVPIVIGLNKIDKDGASPERVMQELSNIGLLPEEWGGDIPVVQISALTGENVDDLLETIMLVAELQELKANPERDAKGTVIEAGLHKSKGPVATFIVQNGTLKQGDLVVCGEAYGKVRALFDDRGNRVDEAGPSMPVQVIGLHNVPRAGDEFEVVSTLDVAREKAEACAETLKKEHMAAKAGDGKVTLSSLASAIASRSVSGLDLHQLNIILKVDVQGTMEAIRQALQVLPQDNVTLKFILQATGDVSTSDIDLASATKAIVVGFNVKAPGPVKSYADNKGIEIRLYRVIYEIIDDIRNAMEGLLDAVQEEIPIGSAEVRAVFSSGSGRVAGCMVTDGKVVKECGIRVMRKRKPVHVGVLGSLRRVKEAVDEVGAGLECGIGMDDYDDWKEGDIIEAFNTVEKKRTLEEASASMAAVIDGAGYSR